MTKLTLNGRKSTVKTVPFRVRRRRVRKNPSRGNGGQESETPARVVSLGKVAREHEAEAWVAERRRSIITRHDDLSVRLDGHGGGLG
jgi:hypothetical protein